MAKKNALIRFYYLKDPNKMSDTVWARSWAEIDWVLRYTGTLQIKQ